MSVSGAFDEIVIYFNSLDTLSRETREISVQHARDILEKLRFKAEDEDSDEEKRDLDEERKEQEESLLQVARAFLRRLAELAKDHPERLNDAEYAPIFEKAFDAIGKVLYRTRVDIIETLIKQGKANVAQSMQAKLENETPQKFKAHDIQLDDVVGMLEAGLTYAELLQKKIAAGQQVPLVQNVPPPQPRKKEKEHDHKSKALDIISMGVGIGYKIFGVSRKELIPAVQQINRDAPDPLLEGTGYKVSGISREELVEHAQKANEPSQEMAMDPMSGSRKR